MPIPTLSIVLKTRMVKPYVNKKRLQQWSRFFRFIVGEIIIFNKEFFYFR